MSVFSALKNRKFLILILIETGMLLFGFLFRGWISGSLSLLTTWKNTGSTYVAYDTREFKDNCYVYYGDNVKVNLSSGDSVRVKCDLYQFIENGNYDLRSPLNEKNVIDGKYSDLNSSEIAIPQSVSSQYQLNISDLLYINGNKEYTVKYIFRDLGNIKEVNLKTGNLAIFIGADSKKLTESYQFAVFDNSTRDFNEIYLFSKTLYHTKINLIIGLSLCVVLFSISILLSCLLIKKAEYFQLYKCYVSGDRKGYKKTLYGINFMLILVPSLLVSGAFVFFGPWQVSLCLLCVSVMAFMIKTIYLKIKIS